MRKSLSAFGLFVLPVLVSAQFVNPELTQLKSYAPAPAQDIVSNYHPKSRQQFLYSEGQYVLNSTTDYSYRSDGKISESLYTPTPFKKVNDWEKEPIRTVYTYNADGKATLIYRYALRNGKEVEIDKKTRTYDEHGNLTELHTLYRDANVGYIYAAYEGSYKFHYTYNDAGQITSIESEWHQPWHDWLKASKRILSYDASGNFIGIERLPYNAEKKEYSLEGACRYINVSMDRFNFEEYFFTGQSLDKLPGVAAYEYQQWNSKKKAYETLRKQYASAQRNSNEARSISFLDSTGKWVELQQNKSENAYCFSSANEVDGKIAAGQGHWYTYNNQQQVIAELTQVWNDQQKTYQPQERSVYSYDNSNGTANGLNLEVYPNPSSGAETYLSYVLTDNAPVVLRIVDASGKQVLYMTDAALGAKGTHMEQISLPAAGAYQVSLTIGDQTLTQKVVRVD